MSSSNGRSLTVAKLAHSTIFGSRFERLATIENIWKTYHKNIEMNFIGLSTSVFTFFFYFLSGFLRNVLRHTYKFKLQEYMINTNFFNICVGQTYFVNSSDLVYLNGLIYGKYLENIFINPLLYIRFGRHYFDRVTLLEYLEDVSELFESQNKLVCLLQNNLFIFKSYYITLFHSLINYYNLQCLHLINYFAQKEPV